MSGIAGIYGFVGIVHTDTRQYDLYLRLMCNVYNRHA